MKRSIELWSLIGFIVTSSVGSVLHFLYVWLNDAVWVAPFSSVNESTWEHMKLIFWPTFIFAIIQSFFFRERKDFLCLKLRGIVISFMLIPVLFYTLSGVIGKLPDWVNISIFFISAAVGYIYEMESFNKGERVCKRGWLAVVILCVIGAAFVVFTFVPPQLGIFKDPITGNFGI